MNEARRTPRRIQVIDSHTGGEPTRVVVDGGPDLGVGSMAERCDRFRQHHDDFRSAVVNEPRGSDAMVGALLCPPNDPACAAGAIYFDNVQTIGMCGHGTMGLAVSLAHLGRIGIGRHRLETPVGVVAFEYAGGNTVAVENVPSYRHAAGIRVQAAPFGAVVGDVAWGGNWFFIVDDHGQRLELGNVTQLTAFAWAIRRELERQAVTGADGREIDHIILLGPPHSTDADSRNFVFCPGGAYDRSPCGTGTSALLSCLYADGKLRPGQVWRQESIVGSIFTGTIQPEGDKVLPRITGSAHVTAEATLLLDPADPYAMGIRS